jgi:hypothetical protein
LFSCKSWCWRLWLPFLFSVKFCYVASAFLETYNKIIFDMDQYVLVVVYLYISSAHRLDATCRNEEHC